MLGKAKPVPEELIGEATELTLEPHDVLYIPRGVLHEASTSTELSLHVTVTVPTSDYCWGVQLAKHLAQELAHSHGLSDRSVASLKHSAVDEVEKVMHAWIANLSLDSVARSFEARMKRTNEGQAHGAIQAQNLPLPPAVTEASRVRLLPGVTGHCGSSVARFIRDDGQIEVPIAEGTAQLVQSLTTRPQTVRDLPCGDPFARICVLQALHQLGVLQLFCSDARDLHETN